MTAQELKCNDSIFVQPFSINFLFASVCWVPQLESVRAITIKIKSIEFRWIAIFENRKFVECFVTTTQWFREKRDEKKFGSTLKLWVAAVDSSQFAIAIIPKTEFVRLLHRSSIVVYRFSSYYFMTCFDDNMVMSKGMEDIEQSIAFAHMCIVCCVER